MKKEAIIILLFALTTALSINVVDVFADELGCCSNIGASLLTCSADRLALRDAECCPQPERNYPTYYKSPQNPDSPANYNECKANFFSPNTACSTVDACTLGCCCAESGGKILPQANCKGSGLTFYKGEINCGQVCPTPQCSDAIDNDDNGCADFGGGDLGCASPTDREESGGSCTEEGIGCSDSNYVPKLNMEVTPIKGQKKFLLSWYDECSATVVSYDIFRCKNSGCTNFVQIGTINLNWFEDSSEDLLFDTNYTYQVKARYNIQTVTPTATKTATLGNIECLSKFSNDNFCIHESYYDSYKSYLQENYGNDFSNFATGVRNKFGSKFNKAFYCDRNNKLIQGTTSCPSSQICIVTDNTPSCLSKPNCNYESANPFGLYYIQENCETDKYCFYDRSHSIVDSCFSCNPSMSCYDYKTQDACSKDNCRVGNCKWKNLENQIGIGVCVKSNAYNCQYCGSNGTKTMENLRAFNEVFDSCTKEKSDALSEGNFKCYFQNVKSKNCENVICKDYDIEQCSDVTISHNENNELQNPSNDECGIGSCQNIGNVCVKNYDGDESPDCATASCESDYFAPNTSIVPIMKKGIIDRLITQIYDKINSNSSMILRTSANYTTFLCVEPCGSLGHPYETHTASRSIIISNLNAFDGSNGVKLLSFNEGVNVIRYYSQDPAKNIEQVKKILVEVHSNTDGPKIFSINITDGKKISDKIYTSNQKPEIDVQFFEPAIVTHSRLVNNKTGLIVPLQENSELSAKAKFLVTNTLPIGEYIFELNAKNKDNIFMDAPLLQVIVIDNSKPVVQVTPANGTLVNTSVVTIKIAFDKEVYLESTKINSEDIKGAFSTLDNKVYTANVNLSDGNKNFEIVAEDYANNRVTSSTYFIIDANPTSIKLANPKFGAASRYVFDIAVETDNDAVCRYSLDDNLDFDFMDRFTTTSSTLHTISNFDKIATGDISTHRLNVKCKDRWGFSSKSFEINVDTTPPQFKNVHAFPNPVVEEPSTTAFTIEADEPVVCKYSSNSQDFEEMEGVFDDFNNNNFKTISRQPITLEEEGNYVYYLACKNKAELISEVKEILLAVDLTLPMSIISHTPEFFNSTNVVLAIETNKKSQCKYSETDPTAQDGDIFGPAGYSHTRQLISTLGKHTFYIICKDQHLGRFSDVASVTFTIDVTPPTILSVNDSSTLTDKPEFTWSTDALRVKFNSIDDESRVSLHYYSLIESGTSKVILNSSTPLNDEWLIVRMPNGSSLNLINGNMYFFKVKAQNVVGLSSNASQSDGITIDASLKPLNCTNGVKDDKESDVDCGTECDLCGLGKTCNINTDCKTNFCSNGTCSAPRCDDNIRNAEESDIDCGGSCKKCQNNKICSNNNDCESGFCSFGFCKPQESCSDNKLSPGESDIDCGGHCPTKCSEGKSCNTNEDCGNSIQCVSSTCKKCSDNDNNCNGISDEIENKGAKDSDGDGLPDEWEIQNGLNPNDPNDANLDEDDDGLINLEEFKSQSKYGKSTNPNLADTDGDGFTDKEEVEKGTSPIDSEDFPKSNFKRTLVLILVISLLVSGFGYLGYKVITKRKEEQFEMPKSREMPKIIVQRPVQPTQQKHFEQARIMEVLRRKEQQKEIERKKLLESFGKEEKPAKANEEAKTEKQEPKETSKDQKSDKKKTRIYQKPKEDAFSKLKEIAKESKKKEPRPKNDKK